ncbi:hypothetical protein J2X02_002654 [Pseudoxanthomonas japonensis]|uniref:hypothetical protein n=1 Tax=Pseudoxanthomonas TaxID=83618 RepID=UPI000B15013B|nr:MULTISPECIES: hypothetical protein [Pseudoxanthomonas]MDR7069803.1 hypothetical protein [Pseudoxanthomonas japonensis]
MRARVIALNASQAKAFCLRLWLELTIAGRGIWRDDALDAPSQANALKWLNEIQHRVWGAHAASRANALPNLLDKIVSCCAQAPVLQAHVRVALEGALSAACGADVIVREHDA